VQAHPLSLQLPSPIKLQCTLQLSGQTQYGNSLSSLVKIFTLWVQLGRNVVSSVVDSDPVDPKVIGLLDLDPKFRYHESGSGPGYRPFLLIRASKKYQKISHKIL
jgi:hypothetical protein